MLLACMYDLKVGVSLGCCLRRVGYLLYLAQTEVYCVELKFELELVLIFWQEV